MTDRSALRRAALGVAAAMTSTALALPSAQSPAGWVARSNEHTRVVLEAQARLAPEGAAQVGVSGVDEQITDLSSGYSRRIRDSVTRMQQELQRRLTAEQDPLVRQDLEILIQAIAAAAALARYRQSACSCPMSTRRRPSSTACGRCSTIRCPRSGGAPRSPVCANTPAPRPDSSPSPSSRWNGCASSSRARNCSDRFGAGRARSRQHLVLRQRTRRAVQEIRPAPTPLRCSRR